MILTLRCGSFGFQWKAQGVYQLPVTCYNLPSKLWIPLLNSYLVFFSLPVLSFHWKDFSLDLSRNTQLGVWSEIWGKYGKFETPYFGLMVPFNLQLLWEPWIPNSDFSSWQNWWFLLELHLYCTMQTEECPQVKIYIKVDFIHFSFYLLESIPSSFC